MTGNDNVASLSYKNKLYGHLYETETCDLSQCDQLPLKVCVLHQKDAKEMPNYLRQRIIVVLQTNADLNTGTGSAGLKSRSVLLVLSIVGGSVNSQRYSLGSANPRKP